MDFLEIVLHKKDKLGMQEYSLKYKGCLSEDDKENLNMSEIYEALKEIGDRNIDIRYLDNREFRQLHIDPIIYVSGASIISAVITAIFSYLLQKKTGTIIIVGATGRKIEIPRDTPIDQIRIYLDMAKDIDVNKLEIEV